MASTGKTVAGPGYSFDVVKSDTYEHDFLDYRAEFWQTLHMGNGTTIRALKFDTHCDLEIRSHVGTVCLSFPNVAQLQFFVGMIDSAASDLAK